MEPAPPGGDEVTALHVRLGPLPFRAATQLLPGSDPPDLLRAYAVFGGTPAHLRQLDRGTSLITNLRRLVLERGAPLADRPLAVLEAAAQTPGRYAAILAALGGGEADWSTVHAGVPDLTASGQVAPYLKRLEDLGLLEVRRSLDASPRSRGRRYRITDPFSAFWYRFVLPNRERLVLDGGEDVLGSRIRPALDDHVRTVFPEICRQHMTLDVMETLGVNARQSGSLWGPGYEIPVAGILSSGGAFYGGPVLPEGEGTDALYRLDREIRETRYGFGRERRIRVLFSPASMPAALQREAARRHDVHLVDARALTGS
jgi:AAA+ ATPase superfamily predicted ATPase